MQHLEINRLKGHIHKRTQPLTHTLATCRLNQWPWHIVWITMPDRSRRPQMMLKACQQCFHVGDLLLIVFHTFLPLCNYKARAKWGCQLKQYSLSRTKRTWTFLWPAFENAMKLKTDPIDHMCHMKHSVSNLCLTEIILVCSTSSSLWQRVCCEHSQHN